MSEHNGQQEDLFRVKPAIIDRQFCEQPDLFYFAAKEAVDAEHELDLAKIRSKVAAEELKATDAELVIAITADPESYGLTKSTEASIKAAVLTQPKHKKAFDAVMDVERAEADLKRLVGMAEAKKNAYQQRKNTLEKMVELQIAGLVAAPKEPRGVQRGSIKADRAFGKKRTLVND